MQPAGVNMPSHDACTRLLTRLEPEPEMLWQEAQSQVEVASGVLLNRSCPACLSASGTLQLHYRHLLVRSQDRYHPPSRGRLSRSATLFHVLFYFNCVTPILRPYRVRQIFILLAISNNMSLG